MENTNNNNNNELEAAKALKSVAIETATEVAATKSAELEAAVESKFETMAMEAKADRAIMQKSIDELAADRKSSFGIGSKYTEKQEQLGDIASEMLSKGRVSTELSQKTFVAGSSSSTLVPSQYDQDGKIQHNPNYKMQLRDVLATRTSDGGSIVWNRETAETDSAAPKTFGASQTQTSKTLTRQESTFRTLSNFFTMPEEFLNDIVAFESYISNRLMMDLLDLESRQILSGAGTGQNYNGLNTFGTQINSDVLLGSWANSVGSTADNADANRYDAIVALSSILQQSDFNPGCVILNPFDYNQIAITKSADGDYVFRQAVDPGTGAMKTVLNTGLQVVVSNAQAANTFTIVDKMAAEYVMREGVAVEFDRNADDFNTNSVSIRAQLRGNIADWLPQGVVHGTFTGTSGVITLIQGA